MSSQLPKRYDGGGDDVMCRFYWRDRPWMARRAFGLRIDDTSSFPSRAVSCAVVYTCIGIWVYAYLSTPRDQISKGGDELQEFSDKFPYPYEVITDYRTIILVMFASVLASVSRIYLGAHYPSDCIVGFIQGVILYVFGSMVHDLISYECNACYHNECYGKNDDVITRFNLFDRIDWMSLGLFSLFALILSIVSVMKPVEFWKKSHQ